MKEQMQSNTWNIKGRLISLDVETLWKSLSEICQAEEQLFPKPLDSLRWTVSTIDGKTVKTGDIAQLVKVKNDVPSTGGIIDLRLYPQKRHLVPEKA